MGCERCSVHRLSGLDTAFLSLETPTCPLHVCGLAVLDPSTSPTGWSPAAVREVLAARLHLTPPLRRRLVEVPFGLDNPRCIEDPDFDLDQHLRHASIPAPGGDAELAATVARIVSVPLERSRPLWEMWTLDGLAGGRVAVLAKIHHAAIDGSTGAELLVTVLDLAPEVAVHEPTTTWVPEPVPSDTDLLADAARSLAGRPVDLVRSVRDTIGTGLDIARRRGQATPPPPFAAPRTSFNRSLTRSRTIAWTDLPLDEVKAVKTATGTTVNDVVLTVCSGALRQWMDERGEHPDGALVAMVPISVRRGGLEGTAGNELSTSLATLATDLDDPLDRLRAIAAVTVEIKARQEVIGADALGDWADFAAPALAARAARLWSRAHLADHHRPVFNLTISNVPGPPFPLYLAGAELVRLVPLGPIHDLAGPNITVMSYLDRLHVGVLACPDVVPDVDALVAAMAPALEELTSRVS